ncbi:MAG: PQQ-binding-like beta-propeller repeat protein [Clostridiales bacterium]|nr:PQQ-binding-like beta-propeller repeat protein [Clostridiales bacterium]
MTNDPYNASGQPPRRRRSTRHGAEPEHTPYQPPRRPAYPQDDGQAPLPLNTQPEGLPQPPTQLPPRREAPNNYDYERFPPQERYEYEDEDDYAPRLWPRLLALVLVMVLLIGGALYFLVPKDSEGILGTLRGGVATVVDGALGLVGLRESRPPQLIKFEAPVEVGQLGVKTVFTFTADGPIDGVRMTDEQGVEIAGQPASVDPERTVWTLTAIFDSPIEGLFRGSLLRGNTWYESDKTVRFMAAAPTPLPSATPAMPALPAFAPPTDAPVAQPTIAPAAVQTDSPATDVFTVTAASDAPAVQPTLQPIAAQPTASAEPFVVVRSTQQPQATQMAAVTVITPPPAQPVELPVQADPQPMETPDLGEESELLADEPVDLGEEADLLADETPDSDPYAEPQPAPQAVAQAPAATPMPQLAVTPDDKALPKNFKLVETVYEKGKRVKELARTTPVNMPAPHEYLSYEGGVFTFRGDSFRGNAAFGTADMPLQQLSVLWKAPLGSLRTSTETLHGQGWTGQPAIVKWSVELREMMNIAEAKKDVKALKEVIAAGQDGKIYFFDLNDGVATREPISLGYPMKGSVSVDTQGRPMMAVGQGVSQLPGKTGPIGYYVYDLITQKQLMFLNGRKTKVQTQFSTNGAFDGTALFDRNSDTLIVAGENGLLYTVALNTVFDYLDKKTITIDPVITFLKSKGNQQDMSVTAEASVAMYGKYIYTVDRHGLLKCVDSDSMLTQWVFDTGDNTDASPALGFDEDGSLGLYTGTTVFTRTRRAGNAFIRRIDALTGREVWKVEVPAKFQDRELGGVKASPVVGQNALSDLVIFTVNLTGDGKTATMLALDKQTGDEVWRHELAAPTVSSPVAVYTASGEGYIVQADGKGVLSLLNGRTGEVLYTLDLEGDIDASPAVYNDVLVIGTSDKDNNYLYGIRLE